MVAFSEYQRRRRILAQRLPKASVAVVPAASEILRNGDTHYPFRQDSHFYYLTGFHEPDALLLIYSGDEGRSILFTRPCDPISEQWTGRRLGPEGAKNVLGFDRAYSLAEVDARFSDCFSEQQNIFYAIGMHPHWEKKLLSAWQALRQKVRRGVIAPESLCDLSLVLGEMRLFKSEYELKQMRRAAEISVAAHKRAMRAARHSRFEYELEAELLYALHHEGCSSVAYPSIVAGGSNACILHYVENNQPLRSGDLVLIDAGGEFDGYAADITRTFPCNGRFSSEQALLYDLVLGAQKAAIALIKPGLAWNVMQETIVRYLTEGLVDLGILHGPIESLLEQEAYKPFYMHQSGHWLGLDVHDVGVYKKEGQWRSLEPGMVLTVEPGLYISSNMEAVDARWRGIGIRIEDDILVTNDGFEHLTQALPVDRKAIEAIICA